MTVKHSGVVLALAMIFTSSFVHAQIYRFEYQYSHMEDTIKNHAAHIFNTVLEITPEKKKFYDLDVYKYDSIVAGHGYKNTGFDQDLLKLKSDDVNQVFYFDGSNNQLFRLKSKDVINWKLTGQTRKSDNFNEQQATTHFGGRFWIAWFTTDIPIHEGPYKFGGLPGLIVELQDSKNYFHYTLTKITRLEKETPTQNILEGKYKRVPIDLTQKQFNAYLLSSYKEPFKNLLSAKSFTYIADGKEYTKASELHQPRIDRQKNIKNEYNPLELNKAVHYPQ